MGDNEMFFSHDQVADQLPRQSVCIEDLLCFHLTVDSLRPRFHFVLKCFVKLYLPLGHFLLAPMQIVLFVSSYSDDTIDKPCQCGAA